MSIDAVRRHLFAGLQRRAFYGWSMLGVAGIGIFASGPGQSHTFSVFIVPISQDLGLTGTEIASAYGFATLIAALALPYMGRLVDRHGPRRMLAVVVPALAIACLVFGAASGLIWLALGFALLRFLGQGSMMLNCANLVAQWFQAKRGFALGLMALGFSVSMAVHPPLAQWLIETVGWRQAWLWLGLLSLALLLPPVLLLVYDRPEHVGLRPDGEAALQDGQRTAAIVGLTLAEALRTPVFYVLAAGMFAMSMLVTALHFFQVTIFTSNGLDSSLAARVFSVSALAMLVAMPVVGRLLDRLQTRYMFAAGLVVTAGSLLAASLVESMTTAVLYAILFGVNNAVTMTYFGYMWPRFFGRLHLGSIQGTGQMIGVVGASLGPLPLGIGVDLLGGFDQTLVALSLLPLLCAVPALFARAPVDALQAAAAAGGGSGR